MQLHARATRLVLAYAALVTATFTLAGTTGSRPPTGGLPAEPDVEVDAATAVFARIVAKTAVARAVLAGRMALPEAAAVFGWLDRQPPAAAPDDAGLPPDSPEDARLYRRAVTWVEWEARPAEFHAAPVAGAALPAVVESDCRELFARARVAAAAGRSGRPGTVSLDGLRLVEGRAAGTAPGE